jgi:hypothetical protein
MVPPKNPIKSVEGADASKNTLISTFSKRKAKGRHPLKHGMVTDAIAILGGASKTKKK